MQFRFLLGGSVVTQLPLARKRNFASFLNAEADGRNSVFFGGGVVTLTFITANKNASEKIPKHLMRFIFTYGRLNHRSFY